MKNKVVGVRVDDATLASLKKAAVASKRTLSDFIRVTLEWYVSPAGSKERKAKFQGIR